VKVDEQADKYCVIIPGYMEVGRIGRVVEGIRKYCNNVVVIDDGSSDNTSVEAKNAGAVVIKHEANQGKGASLYDGFKYAREHGFDFVITMDADGQHDPEDIPVFTRVYSGADTQVLIGNRMSNPACMPLIRRWTNLFMSWLLCRKMGQLIPDTQCGYRLYRCDVLKGISILSRHFEAESEILLRLSDKGIRIGSIPIKVVYRDEKSKIHPVRDTIRFFTMLMKYDSKQTSLHNLQGS